MSSHTCVLAWALGLATAICPLTPAPADCPPEPAQLSLLVSNPAELCLAPGELLQVTLYMDCLALPVSGYQVFLEFDSSVLEFVSGAYELPDPFGLPLVYPILANGSYIDFAAGINAMMGQLPTQADWPLAYLTFTAGSTPALTTVHFRPHSPPTAFVSADGAQVLPALVDTPLLRVAPFCAPHPGDLNCDGVVDFGDINPFVLFLSNFAAWQATYVGCPAENGDINSDGAYPDFGDINPFVALLSG